MTQQDLFPVGGLTKQHKPSPTYLQEPANQRTGPRRAWYKQEFRVQFLKTRGMEFQRLVERVLNAAFPTVFSVIKPKGPRGDLKSDGFIHSRGALLQVYAPDNLNITATIINIDALLRRHSHSRAPRRGRASA